MSEHGDDSRGGMRNHYGRLLLMTILSFVAMYILMYAMVDRFANVHANLNQFYMAGLMTVAMIAIELLVMAGMYPNKKWNAALIALSLVGLALFWVAIRQQTAISDRQFLKSMIPHHAGAILMCAKANLHDADIQQLCREITLGQQKEIRQMEAKLAELNKH